MTLQRMRHTADDMGEDCIITHIVNIMSHNGEYTLCGRAIPDSNLAINGCAALPNGELSGTINDCDCKDCKRILFYIKTLQ